MKSKAKSYNVTIENKLMLIGFIITIVVSVGTIALVSLLV